MTDHGGAASPRTPEDVLAAALPEASATAWAVAGYPEPGPDPTYWERFAHGVMGVLHREGWDIRAAQEAPAPEGLRVAVIRAVASLDHTSNPNTKAGDWWDQRVAPVMEAIRPYLAATPPTPAEPDATIGRRCREEDHLGQISQLGEMVDAARAEARPPEGPDVDRLARIEAAATRVSKAHIAIEDTRAAYAQGPLGTALFMALGELDAALDMDLAARLSAGGATKPPTKIELPKDHRPDLASDLPGSY